MLISRSRSRFWTIVTSRDPVYVATQSFGLPFLLDLLTFLPHPIRILVSFSPVLEFLKVSGLDLQ